MKVQPGWYVSARSEEVSFKKPLGLRRFAEDWVLWRDKNRQVVAMLDRCPHRAAKLSLGKIDGNNLQCPYHGIKFNGNGDCTFVPELKRSVPGLHAATAHTFEKHGFVWVWIGPGSDATVSPPWFEERGSNFIYTTLEESWSVPYTRWIENELDVTHLAYVHSKSIGFKSDPSARSRFEFDNEGIRVFFDPLVPDNRVSSFIELKYPAIWQLGISKSMYQVIAFVPVEEDETKVYVRTYRSFGTISILRPFVSFAVNWFNKRVLAEDERIVQSQSKWIEDGPDEEVLIGQDAAIRHYRKMLAGFVDAGFLVK